VLDLNGGLVTGVGYGSAAPIDRQLGELRLTKFLSAPRGAKLEVRNGTNVVTGRLLSVERKFGHGRRRNFGSELRRCDDRNRRGDRKALTGTPEEKALIPRYTQQVNQREDRSD